MTAAAVQDQKNTTTRSPNDNDVNVVSATPAATEEWKRFKSYSVEVDPNQNDKAKEIKLCNFERPHMRAFHCSWWCFFIAFFIWFAIAPLLSEIRDDLDITNADIWRSSIVGVAGTTVIRIILGPLCDVYGARILFSLCLCLAAIPTACTGLIQTAFHLSLLRAFIGIAGGTFVMCQYWTSSMFANEVVGTANALVAGWGNLGAGVTQIVVGSLLFPLFKVFLNGDSEKAWRTVSLVPAILVFVSGSIVYFVSDDCPKGNYSELKRHGTMKQESPYIHASKSLIVSSINCNSWYLFIQYACCFGVELTMNNAAALYFRDEFGQSTESAAAIASMFGWMNLFARGFGGFYSDYLNSKTGMKGRIWATTILLLLEAIFVFVFAHTNTLAGSIVIMILFSLFVQAAEGAVYGIVPYVEPKYVGSVSGIVGAGGNAGAVAFGVIFYFYDNDYRNAFMIMGGAIFLSAGLSFLINIDGESNLWTKDIDALPSSRLSTHNNNKNQKNNNNNNKSKSGWDENADSGPISSNFDEELQSASERFMAQASTD